MGERLRLFANGSEYMDWESNNCERCVKWDRERAGTCDLDDAIGLARVSDGTVSAEIAARLGYEGDPRFWCREFQGRGKPKPKPAARVMADAGAARLPGLDV